MDDYKDLPLEKVLEYCSLNSLTVQHRGNGWVGRRYVVKLHNHRDSWPLETLEDVRQWILQEQGYWISHIHRCRTDPDYSERQRLLHD